MAVVVRTVQACRTKQFAESRRACVHHDKTKLQWWSRGCLVGMVTSWIRKVERLGTFCLSIYVSQLVIDFTRRDIHTRPLQKVRLPMWPDRERSMSWHPS